MHAQPDPDNEARRFRFEAVALPHMKALFASARRLTGVVEDAEDVVQETYVRAYRTFDNFLSGTNGRAWLFTIMHSIWINRYHRERRRGQSVSLDDLEARLEQFLASSANAEEALSTVDVGGARLSPEVKAALDRLPPDFREAALLVDVEGFSYDDAAGILGCPVGTVRSRLYRARRLLFAMLQDYAAQAGFPRGGT